MTFVIAGGTGTVGSKVTRQLLAQGQQVRVLTRDAGRAAERLGRPDGLELFQIDFSDPSQLAGGFQAGDRVYVGLGGSMTQVQDENALIDAAARAGAEYLVRLSCNGVDTSTKNVILDGHHAARGPAGLGRRGPRGCAPPAHGSRERVVPERARPARAAGRRPARP
jgi:uncharacterized protein YbjT (DUF2867 family)